MKIDKSRRILFYVSLIGIILVTLVMGTTFAYQTLVVDYKEGSNSELVVDVGKLNVSYENTNMLNLKNMPLLPDYKTADYTEFTINTNDTSHDVAYQINLNNLQYTNSLITENFKYTITKFESNNEFVIGEGDFSSLTGSNMNLMFHTSSYRILEKGKDETLRLYIWLKNSENSQDIEKSSFNAKIEIVSYFSDEISETIYKTFKVYGNNELVSKLPEEYEQVEYIETTGTQYINTGVKSNVNISAKLMYEFTTSKGGHILSSYSQYILVHNNATDKWSIGVRYGPETWLAYGLETNKKYTAVINNNITINNTVLQSNFTKGEVSTNETLHLMCYGGNTSESSYYFIGKLYSTKIYNAGNLVRDFVPCYRKSDNVIGLYDLANDVFYTNNGSGTFLKGNEARDKLESMGDYDDLTGKYKISLNINDEIISIYLNEPLRKVEEYADYIDFVNQIVVRYVEVIKDNETLENRYNLLETPIIEPLGKYSIPFVENSNIIICDNNNVCASDIEIESNK